jgi:5-methylcytosine-specific restriction endonuclease McrA
MGVIAAVARELIAAGLSGDELVAALERVESEANAALERLQSEPTAAEAMLERRRAADRERTQRLREECPEPKWLRLRALTFARDGFRCVYCGSDKNLHADHALPFSRGGRSTLDNLVTACAGCNIAKGARTPEEWGRACQ